MNFVASALCLAAVLIGGVASAQAVEIKTLFGHTIRIEGDYPETTLKIDDKQVLADAILTIDAAEIVGGAPVLIGSSSAGGNACDASPFVISFPNGASARLDGPIENCATVTFEVSGDSVLFSTPDIPGKGREQWRWTPAAGLAKLEAVAFKPDESKGWGDLRSMKIEHPSDVLQNGEIYKALQSLLGADFEAWQEIITGTGSGEFRGDDYVGTVCAQHSCGEVETLLFLSPKAKQAYAAWKPYGKDIVVRPNVKEWPEKAKMALRSWSETWQ